MIDITMPDLPGGAGRVRRWLVEPGAEVRAGEGLAIIVTDAVEALIPAAGAGRLGEVLIAAGATAEPGALLAQLEVAEQRRVRATPLARAIAAAHAIDLTTLAGSGPGGRINAADLPIARELRPQPEPASAAMPPAPAARAFVVPPAPPVLPPSGELLPLAGTMIAVDVQATLALIAAHQPAFARRGLELGLPACVLAAVAAQLPHAPLLCARWSEAGIVLRRRRHVALASADNGRLGWRLVRDAADLNVRGLARALQVAAEPAAPAEATFALIESALQPYVAAAPPNGLAAALSFGPARPAPIALDGAVTLRPMLTLSLSYDARVIDHGPATRFLHGVADTLTLRLAAMLPVAAAPRRSA